MQDNAGKAKTLASAAILSTMAASLSTTDRSKPFSISSFKLSVAFSSKSLTSLSSSSSVAASLASSDASAVAFSLWLNWDRMDYCDGVRKHKVHSWNLLTLTMRLKTWVKHQTWVREPWNPSKRSPNSSIRVLLFDTLSVVIARICRHNVRLEALQAMQGKRIFTLPWMP